MNRELATARSLAATIDRRGGGRRTALRRRLQTVLRTLGPEVDPDARTDELLTLLADLLDGAAADRTWLTLAVVRGRLPEEATVDAVHRAARLDGSLRALTGPLLRARPPGRPGADWPDVQVVTGHVLVDLHHTAHTGLATGIQRVAREASVRWARDRHPTFVGWTRDLDALRVLDDAERENALHGGGGHAPRAGPAADTLLVPWHATYVLPELLTEPARARALLALLRFSHTAGAMIGFDTVPISAGETAGEQAGTRFALMLAAMAHGRVVATISESARGEYLGWREMLAGSGVDGPAVVAVPLPTAGGPEPAAEVVREVRADLTVPGLPTVLCVGSHEPRKNHLAVLHAAELVWRRGTAFSLLFVGGNAWNSGDFDRAVLRLQQAGRPVQVVRAMPDDRLAAAYRVARCTVFPSLAEGFGLPVAESLAAGTPVITSDFGSLRDLAADGGAVLVDPRDDHSIADALHRVLTDDAWHADLRAQALRRPVRTWDEYAEQTWDVLTRPTREEPVPEPVPVVVEVTNTLAAVSVTGYQRFVRELLAQLQVGQVEAGTLPSPGTPALDVLPVVWDRRGDCYRRLTGAERESLRRPPRPAPAVTPAGRVRRRWQRRSTPEQRALRMPELPIGAVFFDVEPAWHDPMPRVALLPRLRANGTTVVTMVADVLPEQRPEWFDPRVQKAFHAWLQSHLTWSQLCLTISEDTRRGLLEVAARGGHAAPPTEVVPLGADFDAPPDGVPVALPPGTGRYLLVVGTIEPRKNHALALDLLDRISATHPDVTLVLVGRQGWLVDGLVDRIRTHPLFGARLVWLPSVGDEQLVWLYRHAFLALAPSHSEGLGLPVMEAMRHGVPTVASTGGALPEAGGDLAEYAAPDDVDGWVRSVERHLDDPAHHDRAVTRVRGYVAPTWAAAGLAVRAALVRAHAADVVPYAAAPTVPAVEPTREPSP